MKILFDHPNPFLLAHGGLQIQIEQTKNALAGIGVEVEHLRWWDDTQHGDVIHYFGRPDAAYLRLARRKNIRVVMSPLMGGLGARPAAARFAQKILKRLIESTVPAPFTENFKWDSFRQADACVAITDWEAGLMVEMFQAVRAKVFTIPNGVEEVFLQSRPAPRGPWLVCTASILEVKQVLKLAQAAVQAQTPLWVIGKPFSEADDYAQRFASFARANPQIIRYAGPVTGREELARIYREARGFVLLSQWETLSLAALEAAACQCPLLLGDLPWARGFFKDNATYCPTNNSIAATATLLRKFYDQSPQLPTPPRPQSWNDVALKLKGLYETVLKVAV